eukprot:3188558-Pyramimonas_sp.AAC.1
MPKTSVCGDVAAIAAVLLRHATETPIVKAYRDKGKWECETVTLIRGAEIPRMVFWHGSGSSKRN